VRNLETRDLEVAIATGWVRGQVDSHGVARFLGIPYAEPPIGELTEEQFEKLSAEDKRRARGDYAA
jgi:carboxylesterase type B